MASTSSDGAAPAVADAVVAADTDVAATKEVQASSTKDGDSGAVGGAGGGAGAADATKKASSGDEDEGTATAATAAAASAGLVAGGDDLESLIGTLVSQINNSDWLAKNPPTGESIFPAHLTAAASATAPASGSSEKSDATKK